MKKYLIENDGDWLSIGPLGGGPLENVFMIRCDINCNIASEITELTCAALNAAEAAKHAHNSRVK